jgi:AraC family transcriptional regulator
MVQVDSRAKEIEADIPIGLGRVQLVQEFWNAPIDIFGSSHEHRLELALLQRALNARGCFPDHWGPQRFEPIGPLFFLPAEHRVHAKSDCRRQNSIVCSFDPALVAAWFEANVSWSHGRLRGSLDIESPNIRSLLLRMGEEIRNPSFARETMLELLAAQVAIELSRHLTGIDSNKVVGGLPAWSLRIIDERLSAGDELPSLTELAGLCKLSVRHLTRAFRVSRGRSVGRYIAEFRMENAKRMLTSGSAIKSVAYAMGFSAASNFATAFQRATGETPRQYRHRASRGGIAHARRAKNH